MADTVKIVDPDNEQSAYTTHYTSIQAWDNAWGGVGGNGNCVSNTTRAFADCRCSGGTADGSLWLASWAGTNATYYCYIKGHADYRWEKIYPASGNVYRCVNDGGSYVWYIAQDYTKIEGVAGKNDINANYETVFRTQACTGVLWDCCCADVRSGAYSGGKCFYINDCDSGNVHCKNCLGYDYDNGNAKIWWIYHCDGADVVLHHCTAIDGAEGYRESANTVGTYTLNNCVSYGNTSVSGTWSGDYNGYSAGNPPGSNDISVASTDFADYANRDYTVKDIDCALYDACPTLYSDGTLPVTEDWEGDARGSTGNVCCGFDELFVIATDVAFALSTPDFNVQAQAQADVALVLPTPSISVHGTVGISGVVTVALPRVNFAVTTHENLTSVTSFALPTPGFSVSGGVAIPTDVELSLPRPSFNVQGSVGIYGTVSLVLPRPALLGQGSLTETAAPTLQLRCPQFKVRAVYVGELSGHQVTRRHFENPKRFMRRRIR